MFQIDNVFTLKTMICYIAVFTLNETNENFISYNKEGPYEQSTISTGLFYLE
jgi:hypothetical protein